MRNCTKSLYRQVALALQSHEFSVKVSEDGKCFPPTWMHIPDPPEVLPHLLPDVVDWDVAHLLQLTDPTFGIRLVEILFRYLDKDEVN